MAVGSRKEESKKWHSVGHEVFCYGFPQSDCGEPEIYRRNDELYLCKVGRDGAMHYAYRHGMGHVWNDFDHVRRDHTFVYPMVNGLIGAIAREGIREGVDDTRYVAALQQAVQQASDRDLAD